LAELARGDTLLSLARGEGDVSYRRGKSMDSLRLWPKSRSSRSFGLLNVVLDSASFGRMFKEELFLCLLLFFFLDELSSASSTSDLFLDASILSSDSLLGGNLYIISKDKEGIKP
jgi:hypothetical protein